MKWVKKGRIFKTTDQFDKLLSHSQCPIPLVLEDRIRVYFSSRLATQESLIVYIDIEKNDPRTIAYVNRKPILDMGATGTFDENGMIPNSILRHEKKIYLYYGGWSRCVVVPYKNLTGLAISDDDGISFDRYSIGPILSTNEFDPFSATAPFVFQENDIFHMYYSTGTKWEEIDGKLEHIYVLAYATSRDGIKWTPTGKIVIPPHDEYEAMCKPTIIKLDDGYHMWFCYRGSHDFRMPGKTAYRIGYAHSDDLVNWVRDDSKSGIDVSPEGWDSEMVCYPYVTKVDDKYLMFYNGNGFGKEGFGYAELEM